MPNYSWQQQYTWFSRYKLFFFTLTDYSLFMSDFEACAHRIALEFLWPLLTSFSCSNSSLLHNLIFTLLIDKFIIFVDKQQFLHSLFSHRLSYKLLFLLVRIFGKTSVFFSGRSGSDTHSRVANLASQISGGLWYRRLNDLRDLVPEYYRPKHFLQKAMDPYTCTCTCRPYALTQYWAPPLLHAWPIIYLYALATTVYLLVCVKRLRAWNVQELEKVSTLKKVQYVTSESYLLLYLLLRHTIVSPTSGSFPLSLGSSMRAEAFISVISNSSSSPSPPPTSFTLLFYKSLTFRVLVY